MASGASWILGTSPGGNAPPEVIAAALGNLPATVYYALWRAGLQLKAVPVLKRPGYNAPTARIIETATGPAISVLSQIQRYTQSFADTFAYYSQNPTDAQVTQDLTEQAHAAAAWVEGLDPDVNNIDALVAEYVKVFRTAVTPVAVTP